MKQHIAEKNAALKTNACKRMELAVSSTKPSILATLSLPPGEGRTANQLCAFASGYSLWKQFGTLNFLTKQQYNLLIQTFELPALDENSDTSSYYIWREGKNYYLLVNKLLFCIITNLFTTSYINFE